MDVLAKRLLQKQFLGQQSVLKRMKKFLTAIVSVSIFIVGILLILCADTNFLWYAFNQNVRLTVVAGILIALVGGVGVIMNLWCILKELYSK